MLNLYLFVGPSGTGKSSAAEYVAAHGYRVIQSYTTRPRRHPGEVGHIFITEQEYEYLKERVAEVVYDGYRYCVTSEMLAMGGIYIVEPSGIANVKKWAVEHFGTTDGVYVIGFPEREDVLYERMLARGDSKSDATRRVQADLELFQDLPEMSDALVPCLNPGLCPVKEAIGNWVLAYIRKQDSLSRSKKGFSKKLWARVGMTIEIDDPQTYETICAGDGEMLTAYILRYLNAGEKVFLDGDTYFPDNENGDDNDNDDVTSDFSLYSKHRKS